ncbi:unnamed protein product [Polarella glacialis]|uniref:Uncharacterized protein n=1 Tax=Polarella glacialis TaxID=89957 RepID=A0A813ER42_POLGL|nr:unnamed protein product [Polarella glacialis]
MAESTSSDLAPPAVPASSLPSRHSRIAASALPVEESNNKNNKNNNNKNNNKNNNNNNNNKKCSCSEVAGGHAAGGKREPPTPAVHFPLLANGVALNRGHGTASLISAAEAAAANRAARLKALDALAAGGLRPGQELELISALDLGTVPWSEVPISLKQALELPAGDNGIDSLALNLTVAVQAKHYTNGHSVPLERLTNFDFLATKGVLGKYGPRSRRDE